MAKQINCGICGIHGETVAMNLVNSFFRCPECQAELHVNDTGDNTFIKSWQQQQQYRSCSLPEGVKVHGGGDSTGKSKKEAIKKKTLSRMSFDLYR